jgi:nucleoside 2-deoxyribosyltransferase
MERRKIDFRVVSAWIRHKNDTGQAVVIQMADVDRLTALPFPTFRERVDSYLLAVGRKATALTSQFAYVDPSLIATAYSASQAELEVITRYLQDEGYLEVKVPGSAEARLTPKGHMFADELRTQQGLSSQGFIAMWFDEEMRIAHENGLEPGIRNAGYRPHRVDDAQHIDKIDDRIIAQIRRSRFLVADLTGHRGGVYYEAGFAAGLDKPVFYTCRSDHAENIHFDIRQFNYIKWETPAELAAALQVRIEAVLGRGPEPAQAGSVARGSA